MKERAFDTARIVRVLLAVALALCVALPAVSQDATQVDRPRVIRAVAGLVGVPAEWISIDSLSSGWEPPPWLDIEPGTLCGGEFTVRDAGALVVGRLYATVDLESYRVKTANWTQLSREEIRLAAREFVSSYFAGWSDGMELVLVDGSPQEFEQGMSFFPEAVTCFRWAEKSEHAWTGTYVQVTVLDKLPRVSVRYAGYVAQPRTIEDVEVSEERAIEVGIEEAERRGLEDLQVKQVDLYLDHQVRHFPHYIVIVAEPEPRGKWGVHPLQISVIVHGVTGEVVPASTGYSGGEEDGTPPAPDGGLHDADAGPGDVDARERGGEGHR